MSFLFIFALFLLPFLQFKGADAGCCCCCCPSCCCKPIIIKLPPPPVKLCPCCCNCCCCNKCCCCPCCCGGGGGRKKRSVVDMMAKKFSDVLLPQFNHDAFPTMGSGCGAAQALSALAPLHSLCSQIPPAQRGPACQQITSQQFPLSQNIFNQQPSGLSNDGGEFGCCGGNCQAGGGCSGGSCPGCGAGGACANCGGSTSMAQHQANAGGCPGAIGGVSSLCPGAGQMAGSGNVFHSVNGAPSGDLDGSQAFNYAQNFGAASSPCGSGAGRRKKRSVFLLRKFFDEPQVNASEGGAAEEVSRKKETTKRETKNQNQSLVFRNNLEFVVRQSPQNL